MTIVVHQFSPPHMKTFVSVRILPPSEGHSSREVQRDSHPQVLLLPVEGSFGGHGGAPEHPRRSTAPDASKNFQLQVLQQVNQRFPDILKRLNPPHRH